MLRKSRWLVGIVLVGPLLLQSHAQDDPLFASDEPLAIVFEMPMDVIIKDADDKPVVDGVMRYTDVDGSEVAIDITMTTRGRARLEYCHFPPLKLNIKKKQAAVDPYKTLRLSSKFV